MDPFDNLIYRQALEAQLDELQTAQSKLKGKRRAGELSDYEVFLKEQARLLGLAIQSCHDHELTRRYANHCQAVRHAPPCLQPGVTPRTSLDGPPLARASRAEPAPTRSPPARSSLGRTPRARTSLARPSPAPLPSSRKKKNKALKPRPWYKWMRRRFRLFWMFQLSVDYGTKIRQAAEYKHRLPPCTMVEDPILPSTSDAPLRATPSSSKYPRNSAPVTKSPADEKAADDRGRPICVGCHEPHYRDRIRLFKDASTIESRYPPQCCGLEILLETAIKWLPAKLLRLFKEKQVEYATKNRLYCSNNFCSQFIPPSKIFGKDGYCEKCGRLTCERCKNEAHTGACTRSSSQREFQSLAEEYDYKKCHRCNHLLSISSGCNHVESVCGAELCYNCGKEWKACDCPYADEARVLRQSIINPLPSQNSRNDEQTGTITALHDKVCALVNHYLAKVQSVRGKLSSLEPRLLMLLLGLCVMLTGLYLFWGDGTISRRWAIIVQAVSGRKRSSFSIIFDNAIFGGARWRQPVTFSWATWWKRTASNLLGAKRS